MAQDWIKLRTDLDTDPRVLWITFALKVPDVDLVVGKLWRLWKYADTHTVDGLIRFMTAELLDHIIGLQGFTAALSGVGWLEVVDEGVRIPRFDKHNGETAKVRANDALRKRNGRRNHNDASPSSDTPPTDTAAGANPQRVGAPSATERTPTGQSSAERPEDSGHTPESCRTKSGPRRDETRRDEKIVKSDSSSNAGAPKVGRLPPETSRVPRFSLEDFDFEPLFGRILEVTGERETRANRALYQGYAEIIGPGGLERALSSTRQRMMSPREGKLRKPGGYFNRTCLNIAAEMSHQQRRGAA